MPYCVTDGIAIAGISAAVPENKVLIDSYAETFGRTNVERFKKYTGIHEARRSIPEQTAGDLGFAAAERLLSKLGVPRDEIGVLIFVSQSPDYLKPATACVLQYRLGLSCNCMAFDVSLGCSGFVYGNQLVRSLLKSSESEYGLLIVADTVSKHVDQRDKDLAMLFGDVGTAIVYKKDGNESCVTLLETDGSGYRSLILPAGGFRDPKPGELYFLDAEGIEHSKLHGYMDGARVFDYATAEVPRAVIGYLQHIGKQISDYDYVLMHQANLLIIKHLAELIRVSMEKVPVTVGRYGNTNGASIPLTICNTFGEENRAKIRILAVGFGIGLSLGVTSFSLDSNVVLPVFETDEGFTEGRF